MGYDQAVLKVGGSIITDRSSAKPAPLKQEMRRTAREISSFDCELVLVHGAGSYGHPQVKRSDIETGMDSEADRKDFARIQRLQNELNVLYCRILQDEGVPAFPVQPSASCVMQRGHIDSFDVSVVERLLGLEMVPVLYGVPAVDAESDINVLSGDLIAPYVSRAIDADTVLHATDDGGIYDRDPSLEDAQLLEEITEMPDRDLSSDKIDVSGGVEKKLEMMFHHDQEGRIFSGKQEGNINRALAGEAVGTLVRNG